MDGKLLRGETVLLHRKDDFLKYEMTTSSWWSMVRSEVYRTILIGFPMIIEGKHMYQIIIDEVYHVHACCPRTTFNYNYNIVYLNRRRLLDRLRMKVETTV